MTAPLEDVSSLPGKKISDQEGGSIGEVKEIYAMEDGQPMWVSVEGSFGTTDRRIVLIPLARLKVEDGEIGVPYSKDHIGQGPEVDVADGISAECDRDLRGHYGIGVGDQELRSDNSSYATLVSDEAGAAQRVDDADQLETPDPDKRTDDSMERLHESQRREARGGVGGLTGEDEKSGDKGDADRNGDPEDHQAG